MEKEAQTDATKSASEGQGLVYELAFHLLPTLGEDEVSKEIDSLKAYLSKNSATIVGEEAPKQMNLAYTMIKKQEGKNAKFDTSSFATIKFTAPAEVTVTLEEELRANKNVLRFLIIKTVAEYQPIVQRSAVQAADEEPKLIRKPEVVEEKSDKPVSEAELDKTIKELVSEE